MKVNEATMEDVPCLCELLGILFGQELEFQPNTEFQASGLRAIIGHPDGGRILVLRDGNSVIGMVSLLFLPSTALGGRVAILEDMIVYPDRRGGGSGARLLTSAIECARECQCLRITLLTDGENTSAQRFYQRHGFTSSEMMPMRLLLTTSESY